MIFNWNAHLILDKIYRKIFHIYCSTKIIKKYTGRFTELIEFSHFYFVLILLIAFTLFTNWLYCSFFFIFLLWPDFSSFSSFSIYRESFGELPGGSRNSAPKNRASKNSASIDNWRITVYLNFFQNLSHAFSIMS